MKNVLSRVLYYGFASMILFSTGCKDPEMEISSLGTLLPAPVMTGANPFDQDTTNSNYAILEGTCDSRVTALFLSFDKSLWATPKQNPDVTNSTLSAGTTSDIDCSDGKFKFYITVKDLKSMWGLDMGGDNEVNTLYLKGVTPLASTATLTVSKTSNSTSSPASKVVIEKSDSILYSAIESCEAFDVVVRNDNNQEKTAPQDIDVSLKYKTVAGTTYNSASFYATGDCTGATISTVVVPSGSSRVTVFYKFPSDYSQALQFKADTNTSNFQSQSSPTQIVVRDKTSKKLYLIPASQRQFLKDQCIAISGYYVNYAGASVGAVNDSLTISSSDVNLKLYQDSSCATEATSQTINVTSTDSFFFYMKYTGLSSTSIKNISVSATGQNGSTIDYIPTQLYIDRGGTATVSKINFSGPNAFKRGQCVLLYVGLTNDNYTPVTSGISRTINLTGPSTTMGAFYSDTACTSAITSKTMSYYDKYSAVYYKVLDGTATGTYYNLTATDASSALTYSRAFKFLKVATNFRIQASKVSASGNCIKMKIDTALSDAFLDLTYTNTFAAPLQFTLTSQNYKLYNDSTCTTNLGANGSAVYSLQGSITLNTAETTNYIYVSSADSSSNLSLKVKNLSTTAVGLNDGDYSAALPTGPL